MCKILLLLYLYQNSFSAAAEIQVLPKTVIDYKVSPESKADAVFSSKIIVSKNSYSNYH